ncbi:hypothetical protein CRUP_014476 [Coryphaenoides rupestris]|nr:hypothetical protein CRUP_014476 [Coryphaenoides rupestris]
MVMSPLQMMAFGNLLCLDAFLYVFTLLPVRVILALLRLLTLPCCGARAHTCPYCRRTSGSGGLQPSQVCDVLKGLILLLCLSMMHCVDYSMMYHVGDRLFSSFGQDILDALYWTATEPKERKRDGLGVLAHFLMAVCFTCILPRL